MIAAHPQLIVVMYHYVRDLPRARFPRIKGMLLDDFRQQVQDMKQAYEMASQDSMLDYLAESYKPTRPLCLLTFDDGLKEHFQEVTPILEEERTQGLFFLPTSSLEEHQVLAVHKNHFLMATLEFDEYRTAFLDLLATTAPDLDRAVDPSDAKRAYRWDTPQVAAFKYLLNFRLSDESRERVLSDLFNQFLGDEAEFAQELYVNWDEARQMQSRGMIMGGHSHRHMALAKLSVDEQRVDLQTSTQLLRSHLAPQRAWPFSYPYGKPVQSFDVQTIEILRDLDYTCAFSTEVGFNESGDDRYRLRRIDCKDVSV